MIRTTNTIKLAGMDGVKVACECDIEKGIGIHLIGLADAAVKESLLRTVTALQSKGYHVPGKRIVINLAPADLVKSGTGYDLPIAIAFIAASGQDDGKLGDIEDWLVVGELGLDASVRPVTGTYQAILTAKAEGLKGCIIPEANVPDVAELLDEFPVYGVASLEEAVTVISDPKGSETAMERYLRTWKEKDGRDDDGQELWKHSRWNAGARRAVEIAAAGGHHLLLMGAPGSGKTTLARLLHRLLPPMTDEEESEVAKVYSASSPIGPRMGKAVHVRPFRAPHASTSIAALLGGGSGEYVRPGEVSLASGGVLMLDDFIEAPKSVMEALRVPLEDRKVTISRLRSKVEYPARFRLVATANPCPCGYYGEGDRCTCTPRQRQAYLSRLWVPAVDHITVQAWARTAPDVVPATLNQNEEKDTFKDAKERVGRAIETQRLRYAGEPYQTNEEVPSKDIDRYMPLDDECKTILESLMYRLGLSARAYSRIIKMARTIADLEGEEAIRPKHLAEAASYRFLDRRDFGTVGEEDKDDE